MPEIGPPYSKEEIALRGDAIYERQIRPTLQDSHTGQFVPIDIESGAFAIDPDERAAAQRLRAHYPQAQVWMRLVGRRYLRRLGKGRTKRPTR